jgi:hypothetical protein
VTEQHPYPDFAEQILPAGTTPGRRQTAKAAQAAADLLKRVNGAITWHADTCLPVPPDVDRPRDRRSARRPHPSARPADGRARRPPSPDR